MVCLGTWYLGTRVFSGVPHKRMRKGGDSMVSGPVTFGEEDGPRFKRSRPKPWNRPKRSKEVTSQKENPRIVFEKVGGDRRQN